MDCVFVRFGNFYEINSTNLCIKKHGPILFNWQSNVAIRSDNVLSSEMTIYINVRHENSFL